jgi:hypothetical protein
VQTLNSLSIQVLWYKGLFASATDIISLLYKGCRIDKLTVECSIEDFVKATVELIGQDVKLEQAKSQAPLMRIMREQFPTTKALFSEAQQTAQTQQTLHE